MKKIVFGIPNKPDLGDTLLITPLFKHNPGCTIEFERTAIGVQNASLFEGLAEIKYVNKVKTEAEYFEMNGGSIDRRDRFGHACKAYASMMGMDDIDDFIPYIHITDKDKEFANKFLEGLKNPITLTPVAGGFKKNCQLALSRMLSQEKWNEITEELSKNHDILYFSETGTNYPIKNTIEVFGLTKREMAAIFNKCKLNIGIENGLLHLALASGATICSLIAGTKNEGGLWFPNYGYTNDMWKNEPCRAFYCLFERYRDILQVI